jgi:hypothetical protein
MLHHLGDQHDVITIGHLGEIGEQPAADEGPQLVERLGMDVEPVERGAILLQPDVQRGLGDR